MRFGWQCGVSGVLVASRACMATTWLVSIDGSGHFTNIQSGVDYASTGDTVLVAPGTYISVGSEVVDMKGKAITLASIGSADETIIDGEHSRRGITCDSGESASTVIDGFTVTNGWASGGSGILCDDQSSPTIRYCTISGNNGYSNGYYVGGGIGLRNGSHPTIKYCVISNNTAGGQNEWSMGYGGGIGCGPHSEWNSSNTCSPIIDHCTISGNFSQTYGGGIYFGDTYGGNEAAAPEVTNCIVTDNSTVGIGGGIACRTTDPEIGPFHGPIIRDCFISGNSASEGGGVSGSMMNAYYSDGSSPVLALKSCTLSNNESSSLGGAAFFSEARVTITDCTLMSNRAYGGIDYNVAGGGVLLGPDCVSTLSGCTIRGNSTPGGGGGLAAYGCEVSISECIIESNQALGGGGIGGADVALTMDHCTISGNIATGGGGVGLYGGESSITNCAIRDNEGATGGGIVLYENESTLTHCSIAGNVADSGGGLFLSWCGVALVDCHVTSNEALLDGGGILSDIGGFATLAGSTVCSNETSDGDSSIQISGMWADLYGNT
ncbi:MAG: hypothetical protein GY894_00945, partial [Planctomycetes bacterium]|nr:hypothetical protein [Planctomycetota bacterium]